MAEKEDKVDFFIGDRKKSKNERNEEKLTQKFGQLFLDVLKPHPYKLYYFDMPGRAEGIRLCFHYKGIPFDDIRISGSEWGLKKKTFKFHQLPMLEVDGHKITQTNSILRFLGRRLGLEGQNEFEASVLDQFSELICDIHFRIGTYPLVVVKMIEGDREHLKQTKLIPAVKAYVPFFVEHLTNSKSGFFLESGPSFLDFHVAEALSGLRQLDPDVWEPYPIFDQHLERVHALPQLRKYLETRPHPNE